MIIVLCGVRGSGKDTIGDILRDRHGFTKEAFANPLKEMVKHAFPAFTDEDLYGPSKNREREYKQYPLTNCPWCGGGITYDKYDNRGGKYELMKDPLGHRRCMTTPDHDWLPEFVSPRIALQTLGTEWGRRLYTNVWIDACFERIKKHARPYYDGMGRHMIDPRTGKPVEWDEFYRTGVNYVITDGRFLNETRRSRELGGIVVKLTRGLKESTDPHASEAELRTMPDAEFDHVFPNDTFSLEQLPDEVGKMLALLREYRRAT